jgi:hypothetical protein
MTITYNYGILFKLIQNCLQLFFSNVLQVGKDEKPEEQNTPLKDNFKLYNFCIILLFTST